jgi:hypothetical protein
LPHAASKDSEQTLSLFLDTVDGQIPLCCRGTARPWRDAQRAQDDPDEAQQAGDEKRPMLSKKYSCSVQFDPSFSVYHMQNERGL